MPLPLPPLPHHTLCYCPRACIACLCFASCVFFSTLFRFSASFSAHFLCCILWVTWQWQQIFHVVNGSDRWLAAKLAMPKAAMMTATSTATEAATATELVQLGEGEGERGTGGWFAAQTQFAWKILLVAVHVLNIIHSRQKTTPAATAAAARCKLYYF